MTLGDIHKMLCGKVSLEELQEQLPHFTNHLDIIAIRDHSESSSSYTIISDTLNENIEGVENDDDWEEVYSLDAPLSLINHFKGPCAYYQTAGGGPEGGYVLFDSYLYEVTRHWYEEWSSKLLVGKKLEFQVGDEMKGIPMRVRVF
jgi:hypothetical protein